VQQAAPIDANPPKYHLGFRLTTGAAAGGLALCIVLVVVVVVVVLLSLPAMAMSWSFSEIADDVQVSSLDPAPVAQPNLSKESRRQVS